MPLCPHCHKNIAFKKKVNEKQLVELINQGKTPKEICYLLKIASSTVYKYLGKHNIKRIYRSN
jgi:DNA-binding CsgD family transcriptional regulator